jgi:hypothetical protein
MKLRPTQIAILAAGVVMFIAGFLHFQNLDKPEGFDSSQCALVTGVGHTYCQAVKDGGYSAFNTDLLFPHSAWASLIGLVVAGLAALVIFGRKTIPTIAGMSWLQLQFALSLVAGLIVIGYLFDGNEAGQSWGVGFWLIALGTAALIISSFLELKEDGLVKSEPMSAPTPF